MQSIKKIILVATAITILVSINGCGTIIPTTSISPAGTTPPVLSSLGEKVSVAQNVFLIVSLDRMNERVLKVKWINDSEFPYLMSDGKFSVQVGDATYQAIGPFLRGVELSLPAHDTFEAPIEFPKEALPLKKCILKYKGQPIIDLSK